MRAPSATQDDNPTYCTDATSGVGSNGGTGGATAGFPCWGDTVFGGAGYGTGGATTTNIDSTVDHSGGGGGGGYFGGGGGEWGTRHAASSGGGGGSSFTNASYVISTGAVTFVGGSWLGGAAGAVILTSCAALD